MAEDLGGSPYSDGADHGGTDDEFATVVLDEAFVRSAAVHEPTARERQLAAAEARSEPEPGGAGRGTDYAADRFDGLPLELRPHPLGLEDDRIYTDPWVGSHRVSGAAGRCAGPDTVRGAAGGARSRSSAGTGRWPGCW